MAALAAVAFDRDNEQFEFYISSNRIYSPGEEGVTVNFSGQVGRRTTVQMRAFKITDPAKFFLAQQNPHAPGYGSDSASALDLRNSRSFKPVAAWDHTIRSRERYWQYDNIPVPVTDKGVYLVQASARGKVAATVVVITELGMITKQTNDEILAFVVNRKSGERITDLPIHFARGRKKSVEARTGADGVAKAKLGAMVEEVDNGEDFEGWGYRSQYLAVGARGDDFVIADSYYYNRYGNRNGAMVYLHTDRPVYRPSQTVYYRGIARRVTPAGAYETVDTGMATIEVTDPRGGSVKKDTLRISDFGTFNGELLLADEPPLGDYNINVTIDGTASGFHFTVEEYKKPEYEVLVKTDMEQYTRGDAIKATVNAKYYFGSPVAEGNVEYFVYRSRYWRPWWYRSEWAYLYEDEDRSYGYERMSMISSGTGKLRSDGTFDISVPTDAKADEDYVYRVQANVTDNSRRVIAGVASARVTRGALYVNARAARYVYKPNEEVRLNVETFSFDGDKPVSAPFTVRVERTWWENRRRGDSRRQETVWSGSGSTDGNGTGAAVFAASSPGYYTVYVTAKDSRGTEIATTASLYVADRAYPYWYGDGGDAQIIPDREMYKPGETMSALVIMPEENIDVLVSAEASTLYSYTVERLTSSSAVIRVPITADLAPMFYLNVSAISGDNFMNTNRRVVVTPEGKLVKLVVKPDKDVYKPGERGKVTVRALDARGEPVANMDVAVGMVDEAVYAIRPDKTPDIQKFFYGSRYNQVATNTSLSFSFYAQSRRATARDGMAASAPKMAMAESADMERQSAPPPPPPGSGSEMEGLVQPVIRKDFRDLMHWAPSVRTDARGYAVVDVAFPDNLTTWRITARGVTRATAVGQVTASVIARKDLLVRMETPRFITQGDQLVIATTVHNYLSGDKQAKVTFEAEGVEFEAREQTVTIAANGEKRIDWAIKAPKVGTAKLTVKALTNEESDAMQLAVPVLPRGVLAGASAIADMDDRETSRTLSLTLPTNSDPTTGTLSIALSPSAASSMLGALDELVGYPYGCVEQTMSRFLPTVMVADALKKLDVPFDRKKREELPKMVQKGLMRLYALQHDDGGWGWWEHDETNPFMTAYVLYGMMVAKGAGYDVNTDRFENGMRSLRTQIEARKAGGGLGSGDKRLEATTEAYMLYVATFVNRGSSSALYKERIAALARRDDINNYGVALLAMASLYQNDRAMADRLAERLAGAADLTATSAQWRGKSWHYNWQDDAVETSAAAIKALLEIQGETDLVKKGIHFLLSQKQGDSWGNTRQTAMVVYALADYIKSTRELDPDYTVTVRVNGTQVFSKRFTKADIFAPEQQIRLDAKALRQGANEIAIEKSGRGKLYATARLNYFATGPALAASDAGFKVTREYYALRREMKDGRYVYVKTPFSGTLKSGEEIFVKVSITPSSRYEYFLLEDPLPAGCEVVTKTEGYTIPGEADYGGNDEDYRYRYYRWNWWYADRDVRDEKVAFFAREMQPQKYEFSYIMRAQIPGSYSVMPAVGMLMYYPDVRGNSSSTAVKITG